MFTKRAVFAVTIRRKLEVATKCQCILPPTQKEALMVEVVRLQGAWSHKLSQKKAPITSSPRVKASPVMEKSEKMEVDKT